MVTETFVNYFSMILLVIHFSSLYLLSTLGCFCFLNNRQSFHDTYFSNVLGPIEVVLF